MAPEGVLPTAVLRSIRMKLLTSKNLATAVRYALSVGAMVATGAVFAQDATPADQTQPASAKTLQTVVVTGSRIRSADIETAQPIFTMTQSDIQKTGLVNVGDILANLSVAGAQTFSKAGVLISNPEQGGQYINLRNLGEQRTLVLVNGKRWATSLAGFTDLSTIPSPLPVSSTSFLRTISKVLKHRLTTDRIKPVMATRRPIRSRWVPVAKRAH